MAEITCVSLRLRTMFFALCMIVSWVFHKQNIFRLFIYLLFFQGVSSVAPAMLSSSGYDIYLDPKGERINLNIGYDDWKTWIVMMIAYFVYGTLFYAALSVSMIFKEIDQLIWIKKTCNFNCNLIFREKNV